MNLAAWDALAAVRRDALADDCQALPRLVGDAGKSVGLELACPAQDDSTWDVSAGPVAVLYF